MPIDRPDSDGGLDYLEQKLGIFIQGSSETRRNAALDILTGRVADEPLPAPVTLPVPVASTHTHPSVAYRTAGRAGRAANDVERPRVRIGHATPPPPTRWPLERSLLLVAATVCLLLIAVLGVSALSERADVGSHATVLVDAGAEGAQVVAPITAAADSATPVSEPEATSISLPMITPNPPVPGPASVMSLLVDERFTSTPSIWPNDPRGTAWFAGGTYRLAPRQASHFVAVGIPGTQGLGDAVVTGLFRKIAGPAGGGYGLILRDQNPEARDGQNQFGRYYVFEVGDRGEVGVWLRDSDRWIDLLTWTPSAAVKPGIASNELTVTAAGDHLSFVVNGIPVASQPDTALRTGAAGVFAGGDGNEVALERITVSSTLPPRS